MTAWRPDELAIRAEKLGAGEIVINSIERDGMMSGYDLDLIRLVSSAVDIPVTACGGAGTVADLRRALDDGGAHAAAAGSLFVFYGRLHAVLITFPTAQDLVSERIYSPDQAW